MCLIHEQAIYTQLFKTHNIVFPSTVHQLFQASAQGLSCAFHRFHRETLSSAGFQLLNAFLNFCNLLLNHCLLTFQGHGNLFKLGVPDNDRIIFTGGDFGAKGFSIGWFKILLPGNQKVGGRI